ncbi:hypothetical protein M0804_001993 [Polistes exclamans]|nr:hypothetical protein M0804_001993 [Polistes exclamans]
MSSERETLLDGGSRRMDEFAFQARRAEGPFSVISSWRRENEGAAGWGGDERLITGKELTGIPRLLGVRASRVSKHASRQASNVVWAPSVAASVDDDDDDDEDEDDEDYFYGCDILQTILPSL